MMKRCRKAALIIALAIPVSVFSQKVTAWKLADLQAAIDTANGPTVINFWATFCKPCIAELPHFQALADKYKTKDVRLLLVSLDVKKAYPKAVTAFVKKRKLTAPVFFLDEDNAGLFVPAIDPAWSGAIPATLLINPANGYRKFIEEEMDRKQMENEIRKMIGEQGSK